MTSAPLPPSPPAFERVVLGLSYHGAAYCGWQSQPNGRGVQDVLQVALGRFIGGADTVNVATTCAGRTDAGVHALGQVVHFDTPIRRTPSAWVRGTNSHLPADVAVQWARVLPAPSAEDVPSFHARASALRRRYAYIVLQSPVRPSIEAQRVGWVFQPLNAQAMHQGAQYLIGEHDFSAFRAAGCQSPTPIKTLHHIGIRFHGKTSAPMPHEKNIARGITQAMPCGYWRFDFEGSAFLHHMIRNIMGCLIYIGQGSKQPDWMKTVLESKSREMAAPTFSADGLYFLGPVYDSKWAIPHQTAIFDSLPGGFDWE